MKIRKKGMYKVHSIEARGHGRLGRHWTRDRVVFCGSEITEDMVADPQLIIEEVSRAK